MPHIRFACRSLWFLAPLLGLIPATALAAQPPNAGSTVQGIPAPPRPPKSLPRIKIEQHKAAPEAPAQNVKIVVTRLHVTGETVFSEAELIAVTGFVPGSKLSLTELQAMAEKITDFYRKHGYFLGQAYLPAQEIRNGEVTITVIEGKYGKIRVRNTSRLAASAVKPPMGPLESGELIARKPLERSILLLSDTPGVEVKSTLIPGVSVGTSDLVVDVTPGRTVTGNVDFDNEGNRYTGADRLGATVNLNDPSGHGDLFTLRAVGTFPGLDYTRAAYQLPVGEVTTGAAYSRLDYSLGDEFASLGANGTAKIASVYGRYPFVRSRETNLYGIVDYDAKRFEDRVNSTADITDKKAGVWMLGVNGDEQDDWGGGGVANYSLTWSDGSLEIDSPAALAVDSATARSNGSYDKLGFSAARLQKVTDKTSIYASLAGQLASKNLDYSEKMELGGAYGVRAYPEGEAFADEGYVLSLEVHRLLPGFSKDQPGEVQAIGFVDTGTVTLNRDPWAPGPNRRTLSGAGIGLDWTKYGDFAVKTYYAWKLGNAVATSAPDASGRFWLQAVKFF